MTTYELDPGRQLRFSNEALRTFDAYRNGKVEAGGVLLGRVYPTEVLIETATPPNPADKAGRYFFERSRTVAQQAVDSAWKASDGEQIYVGEWHSHPAQVAEPSSRDRDMILSNLREGKMDIDFLVLVVLGRRTDWVGFANHGLLHRLKRMAE
jgi:integrative and conjugative element protein (TIGR02256 family)